MSYLPYMFDFQRQHRIPRRYVMSFIPDNIFEAIDTSSFEYFPMVTKIGNVRKPRKDRFEVYLDVEDFGPDDIRVRTVDGFVLVEGRQKEKKDAFGWIKKQFSRKCPLPEGYKTETLLSQYSSDGILIITAALVKANEASCDIPVTKKQANEKSDAKPEQPKPAKAKMSEGDESELKPDNSKPVEEEKVEGKTEDNPSQPIAEEGLTQNLDSKDEPSVTSEQE